MFDSLLGKKFTNKCKHSIKCIKARMVPIRKKKEATLRFLKKDVADLIANGFDINAFGRIEALIVEINHTLCYEMIEQYSESILTQLPSLQKQRECPPESREAVSTLIYAAARFSDLPELCDLRHDFAERYGSHSDSYVNPQFAEKIRKKSFSVDKKLRLMQQIAQEFSVPWDCKGFELKISNQSSYEKVQTDKRAPLLSANNEPMSKEADIIVRDEGIPIKRGFKLSPKSVTPKDIHVIPTTNNLNTSDGDEKAIMVERKASEPLHKNPVVPPPYFKPKDRQNPRQKDDQLIESTLHNRSPSSSSAQEEKVLGTVKYWDHQGLADPIGQERKPDRAVNVSNERAAYTTPPYTKSKENSVSANKSLNSDEKKPKPFSVRTLRFSGTEGDSNDAEVEKSGDGENIISRATKPRYRYEDYDKETCYSHKHSNQTPIGWRKHGGSDGNYDNEEKAMDRLLIHYSSKGTNNRIRVEEDHGSIKDQSAAKYANNYGSRFAPTAAENYGTSLRNTRL